MGPAHDAEWAHCNAHGPATCVGRFCVVVRQRLLRTASTLADTYGLGVPPPGGELAQITGADAETLQCRREGNTVMGFGNVTIQRALVHVMAVW